MNSNAVESIRYFSSHSSLGVFLSTSFIPDFIFCCFFSVFTICTEQTNKTFARPKRTEWKANQKKQVETKRNEKLCSNDGQKRDWKQIGKRVRNEERRNRMRTRRNYSFYFAFCVLASWGLAQSASLHPALTWSTSSLNGWRWGTLLSAREMHTSSSEGYVCLVTCCYISINCKTERVKGRRGEDEEKQTTKCNGEFTNVHEVYYFL